MSDLLELWELLTLPELATEWLEPLWWYLKSGQEQQVDQVSARLVVRGLREPLHWTTRWLALL